MNKLFVANTTKQNWVFTYRLPGGSQHHQRRIAAGQQICLDHLQEEEIESVIKQNAVYGMRPAAEASRRKGFAGLIYSVGKDPINIDRMLETFDSNDETRNAEAQTRREKTAAAMSENIADTLHKATGVSKEKLQPTRLEVEVVEETDGKPTVSSGVEVLANPDKTAPRRARMS